jgi:hypothetical protein
MRRSGPPPWWPDEHQAAHALRARVRIAPGVDEPGGGEDRVGNEDQPLGAAAAVLRDVHLGVPVVLEDRVRPAEVPGLHPLLGSLDDAEHRAGVEVGLGDVLEVAEAGPLAGDREGASGAGRERPDLRRLVGRAVPVDPEDARLLVPEGTAEVLAEVGVERAQVLRGALGLGGPRLDRRLGRGERRQENKERDQTKHPWPAYDRQVTGE